MFLESASSIYYISSAYFDGTRKEVTSAFISLEDESYATLLYLGVTHIAVQ